MSDCTVLALPAGAKPDIFWYAPLFEYTGYANEARNFILGLRARGVPLRAGSANEPSKAYLTQAAATELQALRQAQRQKISNFPILVQHVPGHSCTKIPATSYQVARTMLETYSLPENWAEHLNAMDEVWVPSAFNVDTFRRGGVTVPLRVVPGGVDTEVFRPGLAPLRVEGLRRTVFLSVFEWSLRKGWDVLLTAWARTFSADDDVTLLLRTRLFDDTEGTRAGLNERIDAFLSRLGTSRQQVAPIRVLTAPLAASDMPRLYATATAYVHPSRGEGWGRPIMEAMSSGLAAIATGWSGNTAFMTAENSMSIDSVLVDVPEHNDCPWLDGQRWAEPSAEHLCQLMRSVVDDPDRARAIGARARADVEKQWTWANAVAVAERRLVELRGSFLRAPQVAANDVTVRWVGDQFAHHSLSNVNREICARLAMQRGVALEVASRERRQDMGPSNAPLRALACRTGPVLPRRADVEVRHQWPPDWAPPPAGCWVAVQPWEFGGIPDSWVKAVREGVDEVWCYSTYIRDCYVLSGVPRDRVHVVPIGVDSELFSPEGAKFPLRTQRRFRFLFVGGTIARKGIDVLLDAYVGAFRPDDDVCLVVKSTGSGSFYKGQCADELIRQLSQAPGAPEIELIDDDLAPKDIAALYRSCDVLVHPYRGEGFALPVAEAMAAGLPVVVTGYGACMDYCDESNAYLVPAGVDRLRDPSGAGPSSLGYWWAAPSKADLARLMRHVRDNPAEAAQKAVAARARIQQEYSWDAAARKVRERLDVLAARTPFRLKATASTGAPMPAGSPMPGGSPMPAGSPMPGWAPTSPGVLAPAAVAG